MSDEPRGLLEAIDRRDFSETADAILLTEPRFARSFFPLLGIALLVVGAWAAFLPFDDTVVARGEVRVVGDTLPVQAESDGRVIEVLVGEGDSVEKGQILFRLDAAESDIRVERVRSELASKSDELALLDQQREGARSRTKAELGRLDRELERQRKLLAQGLASAKTIDDLQSERTATASRLQEEGLALDARREGLARDRANLERDLESARLERDRSAVRAPAAGVVSALAVTGPGRTVASDTVLARLMPSSRPLELEAVVPPSEIVRVRVGAAVRVKLDPYPYREWGLVPGRVVFVAPDRVEAGYVVRLELEPERGSGIALRAGMPGTAEILSERLPVWRFVGRKLGFLHEPRGAVGESSPTR